MPTIIFRPNPTPPPFVPKRYLTFTALEDDVTIGYIYFSEDYEVQDAGLNIEYSLDNGDTWQPYEMALTEEDANLITLQNRESVMFRGNNANLAYYIEEQDDYQGTKFIIDGLVLANGDVTSLLNGIGGDLNQPEYCYYYMFHGCTGLTTAPSLPATTLATSCYTSMFNGCNNLNYVEAMFLTTPGNTYTSSWLLNVAANGTFVKNSQATWDVTGANGVPIGWTITTA